VVNSRRRWVHFLPRRHNDHDVNHNLGGWMHVSVINRCGSGYFGGMPGEAAVCSAAIRGDGLIQVQEMRQEIVAGIETVSSQHGGIERGVVIYERVGTGKLYSAMNRKLTTAPRDGKPRVQIEGRPREATSDDAEPWAHRKRCDPMVGAGLFKIPKRVYWHACLWRLYILRHRPNVREKSVPRSTIGNLRVIRSGCPNPPAEKIVSRFCKAT
jgi:hypothetical protein